MDAPHEKHAPRTALCRYTTRAVYYGDDDLVDDLLGRASFVDVFMKQTFGRMPTDAERRIVDAVAPWLYPKTLLFLSISAPGGLEPELGAPAFWVGDSGAEFELYARDHGFVTFRTIVSLLVGGTALLPLLVAPRDAPPDRPAHDGGT